MMNPPTAPMRRHPPARRSGGFTLIEVLVSMLILTVLAMTAWKGMDAIGSARRISEDNLKQTLRLQAVMTQFEADMGQVVETLTIPAGALQFDGANLRATRKAPGGVQVVVWFLRRGQLMRWVSPVTTRLGELEKYWFSSFQLRGREPGTLVALKGVAQFQVYCFRNGSLNNCQSTGDTAVVRAPTGQPGQPPSPDDAGGLKAFANFQALPQAVRCQITMGEGSGFSGRVSRDLMLAPQSGME